MRWWRWLGPPSDRRLRTGLSDAASELGPAPPCSVAFASCCARFFDLAAPLSIVEVDVPCRVWPLNFWQTRFTVADVNACQGESRFQSRQRRATAVASLLSIHLQTQPATQYKQSAEHRPCVETRCDDSKFLLIPSKNRQRTEHVSRHHIPQNKSPLGQLFGASLAGTTIVPFLLTVWQTSSAAHSRRQVLVQLTANVEGLGFTGDRVLVSPGRARNQLIPARQAAFVPWKRASEKEERVTMVRGVARQRTGVLY